MTNEARKKSSRAYGVGYGRPPKAHQFKPGQSGNPNGKPKGAPTLEELFAREARCFVKIKSGEDIIRITKLEALVRRVFQKALEGDLGAVRILLQLAGNDSEATDEDSMESAIMPDDEAIKRILGRFSHLLSRQEDSR